MPGSAGEHRLQQQWDTTRRACAFYNQQVLEHLNPTMQAFIARQELLWIATADARGECDCSFRAGPPGFVRVVDPKTCAFPEYRGNGVMASLGNISENPHIGLVFIDFFASRVGLHINGRARIVDAAELPELETKAVGASEMQARCAEPSGQQWVLIEVAEAYIHCSKHIPLLAQVAPSRLAGADGLAAGSGDYFRARATPRPWTAH